MKIEVGKTYKDRLGDIITIAGKDVYHTTSTYPYLGDNASIYMEDGRYDSMGACEDYDLIEEVPTSGSKLEIAIGKCYKTRQDKLVTITGKSRPTARHIYPFTGSNDVVYMSNGKANQFAESDLDLIEEVSTIAMFGSTWTFNNLKEEQTMKLEVGKSYKNRGGDVVSIVNYFSTHNYPYQDESGNTYLEDGTALQGQTSFRDLVKEHFVVDILGDKYTFKATAVEEPKQQEEEPMQDQIVTLNCTLTVTTAYGEPRIEIYPKDEAWRESNTVTVLDTEFEVVLSKSKIEELYTKRLADRVQKADEVYRDAIEALDTANDFLRSL